MARRCGMARGSTPRACRQASQLRRSKPSRSGMLTMRTDGSRSRRTCRSAASDSGERGTSSIETCVIGTVIHHEDTKTQGVG